MKKAMLFLAISACFSCFELEDDNGDDDTCIEAVQVSDGKGGYFFQFVLCD